MVHGMDTSEAFIWSVQQAVADGGQQAVDKVLREALTDWAGPPPWLGPPRESGFPVIYTDSDLTIMSIVWPPHLVTEPHNHNMWATIALYDGRENNIVWRRDGDSIVPYAAESIGAGDVFPLDADAIHSVHNPLSKYTAAIHVYGGDFMATPRSEWEPEHLVERPRDMEAARQAFAEADQPG
jgi:predicted metal-dependent enzyme (double-stranded beta helix superfamily)